MLKLHFFVYFGALCVDKKKCPFHARVINKNYAISKVVNTIPKLKYFSQINYNNDNIPAGDAF